MKINHKIVAEHLGVRLRGDETFTELLEIEKQVTFSESMPKPKSIGGKNETDNEPL
jgi:hypothetical protein